MGTVIVDPGTGVRLVWRGGSVIRAYDRRARLISSVDAGEDPQSALRHLAEELRRKRDRRSNKARPR